MICLASCCTLAWVARPASVAVSVSRLASWSALACTSLAASRRSLASCRALASASRAASRSLVASCWARVWISLAESRSWVASCWAFASASCAALRSCADSSLAARRVASASARCAALCRSSSARRAARAISKSFRARAACSRASSMMCSAAARRASISSFAAAEDLLGLLLGESEDLLDPRTEVPERGPVDHVHLLAHLGQVALENLDLAGQLVDLCVRLFPFGGEGRDLVLGTRDVPVDLFLLVPPQSGLEAGLRGHVPAESEQFLAVRHAPILTRIGPCWGDTDGPCAELLHSVAAADTTGLGNAYGARWHRLPGVTSRRAMPRPDASRQPAVSAGTRS